MIGSAAPQVTSSAGARGSWQEDADRRIQMATEHYSFIWRSLRRLGVAEQATADAAQQVFVLATEKIAAIAPGRERSFLFQTALRVAMSIRRTHAQRREALVGQDLDDLIDSAPLPDDVADHLRRRRHLDELLEALPMDLREVFVLCEIEELDAAQVATLLDIPPGTVASRLRRAREAFARAGERLRKRLEANTRRAPHRLAPALEGERGILASARRDEEREDGLHRTLLALRIGVPTGAAPCASTDAGPTRAATNGGQRLERPALGAGAGGFAKWLGVAAAVLAVGGAVAVARWHATPRQGRAELSPVLASPGAATPPEDTQVRAASLLASPLAAEPEVNAATPSPPPPAPSIAAHAAMAPATHPSPAAPAASPPGHPSTASSMDAELRKLAQVRALLAGGHPAGALEELDGYDRSFPASALGEEAQVLRVDALVAQGRRAEAAAVARRFLSSNPASPHAAHLLHVLGAVAP